jgi:hypothetical protein
MRPVEFGEAVPAGTRLTLFSADKPGRHFTVITFLMDKVSGVALDFETGVPCYQVEDGLPRRRLGGGGRKAEFIYCFNCHSKNRTKTAGAFGGPTRHDLTQGPFLTARWSRSRKAGAMEYWSVGLLCLKAVAKCSFFQHTRQVFADRRIDKMLVSVRIKTGPVGVELKPATFSEIAT